MDEILDYAPDAARVLDLGSHNGSFPAGAYRFLAIRVDIGEPKRNGGCFVQADAASLPFRSRTFDVVVLNHSLEHFVSLKRSLQEVGRVIKREGAVFVAVPDARTQADRIYRKLYRDRGGHVNLFGSPVELATMLSWYFGLPHVATRSLCCSFSFLNRTNMADAILKRWVLLAGLPEPLVALLTAGVRLFDRWFHTRASIYGWALYFGAVPAPVDLAPRTNVCIRCGQGHPSEWLARLGLVRRKWKLLDYYNCPGCGAANWYSRDSQFVDLK